MDKISVEIIESIEENIQVVMEGDPHEELIAACEELYILLEQVREENG